MINLIAMRLEIARMVVINQNSNRNDNVTSFILNITLKINNVMVQKDVIWINIFIYLLFLLSLLI